MEMTISSEGSTCASHGDAAAAPEESTCKRQVRREKGWRRVIRNFTPSWFAVNMGTGIVSILLHNLPYNGTWLQYISYIIFAANVALFLAFLVMTILRYVLYPQIWTAMILHPSQSLFLGCFPMGLATIINMIIFCCKQWGDGVVYFAWALWWFDVLVSVATAVGMSFIVMTKHHHTSLQSTTSTLLLPIVACIVAAATGAIVADALPDPSRALTTLITSYILWGIGQGLSACVIALYYQRLTLYSLPAKELIVSTFLPVGPLGQGGFGIQQMGVVAVKVLPRAGAFRIAGVDPARCAEALYVIGVFIGMLMWGFALVWVCFALMSLATTKRFPFNMGWWALTFPLGVWGTCTGMLATNLDSAFFRVATTIISLAVLVLWLMVSFKTLRLTISGEMFFAPCLKDVAARENDSCSCQRVERIV